MRNHKVNKEDFHDFFPRHQLCGQHSHGKNKSIDVIIAPVEKRVWYEFTNHKAVIYTGTDLNKAIKYYNEA